MSEPEPGPNQVEGERGASSVTRALSMQSRVSNALAIGLMSLLGLGSLTWYYANTMRQQGQAKRSATAASTNRAQGDMPLPSLGRIDPPKTASIFDPLASVGSPPGNLPTDQPLAARTLTEIPLAPSPQPSAGAAATKSPAQLALERELSGVVFSGQRGALTSTPAASAGGAGGTSNPSASSAVAEAGAVESPGFGSAGGASGGGRYENSEQRLESGELTTLLRPTSIAATRAQVLPARRLLLPKGAFIDCTLETAIDSTLPGMTTCVMATDAFGVDGKVVLLERGTKLIGETRGQVQQGAARVFVLWTEARTPTGVIVPLDSPGTDEIGRSGLPGTVNHHFWQRFGAAMLVSVIDGAVQAAAQSANGGSGNVIVNPSASQDVLTEILKNTINIPPTVVKQNGDRIQVLVARDVDFRSVYELRPAAAR